MSEEVTRREFGGLFAGAAASLATPFPRDWSGPAKLRRLVERMCDSGVELTHVDLGPPAKAFWDVPPRDGAVNQKQWEEFGIISTVYAEAVVHDGVEFDLWLRQRLTGDYEEPVFYRYAPENVDFEAEVTSPEMGRMSLDDAREKFPPWVSWR